jgi:hypothetical protein
VLKDFLNVQLFANNFAECVFDFLVSGNGNFPAVFGVHVDVVTASGAFEKTAVLDELPKEGVSFQTSTSISFS